MKLVNHGAKLQLWELDAERSRIFETVHRSGLAPLTSCSHRVASRPMLSAFCERWQPETTTFHLPFSEMTITLDDVASILHIPITGSMISFSQPLRVDDANALLVELLGTTTDFSYSVCMPICSTTLTCKANSSFSTISFIRSFYHNNKSVIFSHIPSPFNQSIPTTKYLDNNNLLISIYLKTNYSNFQVLKLPHYY